MEDAKRGKYSNCIKGLLYQGFSKHEAETACAKHLGDTWNKDEIWNHWNTLWTDSKSCVDRKISIFAHEHPEWKHDKVVAAAHGYCEKKARKDADEISMSSVLSRSTNLSLSRFATLIKAVKTRHSLKAPHMGILPQRVILPMKNLNRLQTKLEKLVTEEQKWLTMEQYEQRKQYARYMRKTDAEDYEMTDLEFTDAINDLYLAITDYYPNLNGEEAIDRAFMPPQGDNAWVVSNEAQIISMNDGLNNIIKAPIILAKEMIQEYTNDKGEVEYHFKPYSELKLAAKRYKEYDSLDIIIEHKDWYDVEHVMGKVKQIRADDKTRTLRGMGYFYENKLPQGLRDAISSGEIISVSIGFLAKLGSGGEWNGQEYDYRQENILLRHLAICVDSVPRCPPDKCGINLKDTKDQNKENLYIIIKKPNYYINICEIFKDSKTETNTESSIQKQEEKVTMHEDSDGKIKSEEPDDLEAILIRLRRLINDEGWEEELKHNAIARILSAVGIKSKGDNMDEKEYSDAIAKKDAELEELKVSLADAKELLAKFEEKERLALIQKIKKFGDKYSDEELQNKDIDTLNIIADAFSKFKPSEEPAEPLPKKGQDSKEEMEEELKGKLIDFSKVFDDVNKEFGL
jgi:hypothetical protein